MELLRKYDDPSFNLKKEDIRGFNETTLPSINLNDQTDLRDD